MNLMDKGRDKKGKIKIANCPPSGGRVGEGSRTLKLAQKPYIILIKQTDVIDLKLEHGNTFYAHAEGKAGVFFAVYLAIFQNFRVYHSAAEYLHPSALLAHRAAFASADETGYIYFGTGLGERKIRGT